MADSDAGNRQFETKLKRFLAKYNVDCTYLQFTTSCHSVQDAAESVNAGIDDFIKNICMIDPEDNVIIAIVKGEHRASTSRVAKALNISRPRIASPEEIPEKTGYPCGGVPAFGYPATYLIDPKVIEKAVVYTSGGSDQSLIQISPIELQRINQGSIVRVRK